MATLDDSPSLFTGQTWDVWDEAANGEKDEGDESDELSEFSHITDSMKLQRQDMNLFGFCPSRDEFFLVVCDNCGQVVKPQALQAHIETRHKYSIPKLSPIPTAAASHNKSPPASSSTPTRSSTPSSKSSSSGKGPPSEENVSKARTLDSRTIARSRTSPAKSRKGLRDIKLKKNHTMPVVKVERIPSPLDGTVSITSDRIKTMSPITRVSPAPSPARVSPEPSPLSRVKTEPNSVSAVSPAHSPVMRDSVEDAVTELINGINVTDHDDVKERLGRVYVVSSPSPVATPVEAPRATTPPTQVRIPSPVFATSTLNATSSSDELSLTSPILSRPDPRTVPVLNKKNRYPHIPKQEKLLPCKDREYDCDKHCGVWIADIQKPCTRSLTCKTHALSLRRAVVGRSMDFDTLLDDHRTAKEEILRAKAEANGMPFVPSKAATKSALRKAENERRMPGKLNGVIGQSPCLDKALTSPLSVSTNLGTNLQLSTALSPPRLLQKATKLAANNKLHKPLFSPGASPLPGKESTPPPEVSSRLSSDGEEDCGPYPAMGVSFIKFHPRPAASCKFNARQSGSAVVFNRKQDLLRAAFSQAVEKHLHPPPHKKLCVESKLPREASAPTISKDPYEFIFVSSPHTKVPGMVSSSAGTPTVLVSTATSSLAQSAAPSVQTTSLLTAQNHVTTLLPGKFVVQKAAVQKKPSVNRTIKPKEASLKQTPLVASRRPSGSSPQSNVAIAPCNQQPIPISIPNTLTMNLGNVGSLNTVSMGGVERKNSVVLDPGLANGQFLSISSMAELQSSLERKRQQHHSSQQQAKLQKTGNSILTCLPNVTYVVENKAQLTGQVVIGTGASSSPQHVRPSPTASPLVHTGTISPQVLTTSPLSNGIVPSPSSLKNVSYTITAAGVGAGAGAHGTPSPASVGSPSPSFVGSAGEDMSPIQRHVQQSIVNHSLVAKSRPHKPNSRPPGGVHHHANLVHNNNTASQPPRIISALHPGQFVARSKVSLPPGAASVAVTAAAAAQKRAVPQKHHVTIPLQVGGSVGGPVVGLHQGALHQAGDLGEPPLKRPRADIRVHHQNSPSNFISQHH